jgi:hypothetical protein
MGSVLKYAKHRWKNDGPGREEVLRCEAEKKVLGDD